MAFLQATRLVCVSFENRRVSNTDHVWISNDFTHTVIDWFSNPEPQLTNVLNDSDTTCHDVPVAVAELFPVLVLFSIRDAEFLLDTDAIA